MRIATNLTIEERVFHRPKEVFIADAPVEDDTGEVGSDVSCTQP